jgi:hypothetical protein
LKIVGMSRVMTCACASFGASANSFMLCTMSHSSLDTFILLRTSSIGSLSCSGVLDVRLKKSSMFAPWRSCQVNDNHHEKREDVRSLTTVTRSQGRAYKSEGRETWSCRVLVSASPP